ncbi:AAA family ATPase [Paenibacillus puerhi]|uniref:AAA family ATPase n=1 Tax=Paenibacillus puerhi TaxID=2692622 RepID=UPI00135C233D|nr:AAA family ATPase [Paenibacillus puerhi]
MAINKINLENFTVFEKLDISFSNGINVFIGENGTGKTHIMKVIYSACQAARIDVSFSEKLVKVFKPDNLRISRLARRKPGNFRSMVVVESDAARISAEFHSKTNKWDAEVTGEAKWEKQLSSLTSTFIPAKEILSNAWNLEAAVDKNNVDFDETYIDIITSAKVDISAGKDSKERKKYLDILQNITSGKVTVENERFYLKPGSHAKIEFSLVAEGIRKIALLWQLIKNGTLEKGAVLFWDEPEANINPAHIPVMVDMLLELQRSGVQIFISTHDYVFSKYLEVKRNEKDDVIFYSLYPKENGVEVESNRYFKDLRVNAIVETFDRLLEDVFNKNLGD